MRHSVGSHGCSDVMHEDLMRYALTWTDSGTLRRVPRRSEISASPADDSRPAWPERLFVLQSRNLFAQSVEPSRFSSRSTSCHFPIRLVWLRCLYASVMSLSDRLSYTGYVPFALNVLVMLERSLCALNVTFHWPVKLVWYTTMRGSGPHCPQTENRMQTPSKPRCMEFERHLDAAQIQRARFMYRLEYPSQPSS